MQNLPYITLMVLKVEADIAYVRTYALQKLCYVWD